MGLRCDDCLDKGVEDFKDASKDGKVKVSKYDGKNKCGGCGKKTATHIITYT